MKAVIVNCFDTYEDRVDLVHEFLKEQGYDVTVIQSDFRHFKKVHREVGKEEFIFVKTKPYYKNLSVARISSHYKYAEDAFKIVEEIQPDVLYTMVPSNSLARFAALYKRKYQEVKLIFDIMDLWPETMPIGKVKSFPPFSFWGSMRDKSLKYSDHVITECDYYQSVIGDVLKGVKVSTLYLAKKKINVISNPQLRDDQIHLAYLGSINNIIDIPRIKEVIKTIREIKPVTLHIIGDGEKKQELIDSAKAGGATIEYHGEIYDPQRKQDIFDRCNFGLNIMKESVFVGLTMKSIDYFQHGLPIINNIPADTAKLVENYGVGINILDSSEDKIMIMNYIDEGNEMRNKVCNLFNEKFSANAFFKNMESILKVHSSMIVEEEFNEFNN